MALLAATQKVHCQHLASFVDVFFSLVFLDFNTKSLVQTYDLTTLHWPLPPIPRNLNQRLPSTNPHPPSTKIYLPSLYLRSAPSQLLHVGLVWQPSGSNNYSVTDIQVLLDLVEDERPLGQKGWQAIHLKYSEWARKHERPPRKVMSLETKFKQVSLTSKYFYLHLT
jgi:hypothetical protein